MKTLFIVLATCLAIGASSQNATKDTIAKGSMEDFGTRIYDTRIGRYMSMDTSKSNKYSDTIYRKQLADKPKRTN